jgi:hypothetical protein
VIIAVKPLLASKSSIKTFKSIRQVSQVKKEAVCLLHNKPKETNQKPAGGFLIAHFKRYEYRRPQLKLLLIMSFLITALSSNAAEFTLDSITVRSTTIEKEVQCKGYNIILSTERFPAKYEMRIPKEFRIAQYYGPDFIIGQEAYLTPGNFKIPLPNELKNIKDTLLPHRTFLPYKALCKENAFVVFYGSGGNCDKCEVFLEFEVVDGKLANPKKINYSTVKQEYE